MSAATGRCLCGAVSFALEKPVTDVSVCHCSMCRRHSGGPVIAAYDVGDVRIEGAENLTWYRSSDWGERGFCKVCGSNLFWRLLETGETFPSAGALDDLSGVRLESHIFIDSKPDCYDFAGDAPRLTEAEVLESYAKGD